MKVNILIIILGLLGCFCVSATTVSDTVRVYFHDGDCTLDRSLRDNAAALDGLASCIVSGTGIRIIAFSVEGNTSPTGSHAYNRELSKKRAVSVLEYLRSYVEIPDSLVTVVADGIDWDGLASLVERDTTLIGGGTKNRILSILRDVPVFIYDDQGRLVDGRKKQLMELDGGKVFRLLERHYFAALRNIHIEIRYRKESEALEKVDPELPDCFAAASSSVSSLSSSSSVFPAYTKTPVRNAEPLHRMAIKTNLVYDAVLMPSLEVEYRINNRWSVNVEGDVAWWKNNARHRFYQIATISPEARYWFKTQKPWNGHYIGAFAGGSWYDLENGGPGYKGEGVMAGISYGYMFPISRSLSFEAGLGLGYLFCENEEYLPIDGHYVYQQTSRFHYFGPLKLKFALVWRIWDVNRKKGGAR